MSKLLAAEKALHKYERSYCECGKCKAGCKSMPGMLSPEDVIQIGDFCGAEPEEDPAKYVDWAADHFAASEGAQVMTSDGRTLRIPTIVPKQNDDGRCVFLDEEDKCSIHPVSPYGCRQFKVCDDDDQELDNEKSRELLTVISQHQYYNQFHSFLEDIGNTAPPLLERKRRLVQLIHEEEKGA